MHIDLISKSSDPFNFGRIPLENLEAIPRGNWDNIHYSRFHNQNDSQYFLYKGIPAEYLKSTINNGFINRTGKPQPEHSGQSPGSKTGVGKGRVDPHEIEMAQIYLNEKVFNKDAFNIPAIPVGGNRVINVAILDTACSEKLITNINSQNITIENIWAGNSTETSHGDAVVISFLEGIQEIETLQFQHINIKVYDVSEVIGLNQYISLFHVLNALDHINKVNRNISYVNMSFVFTDPVPWLNEEMGSFFNQNPVNKITCAVGNNNRMIQPNPEHPYQPYPAVYELIGKFFPVMGIGHPKNLIWQSKRGPGSNYPKDNSENYYAGQAIFDYNGFSRLENLTFDGGTSFAAPRVLAQLIATDNNIGAFAVKDIIAPESNIDPIKVNVYSDQN